MRLFFLFFFGASLLLFSGCFSNKESSEHSFSFADRIRSAQEEQRSEEAARVASLSVQQIADDQGHVVLEVWLKNPKLRPIAAVRSFLSFPAHMVEGESLVIPEDSPFSLVAPEENGIDAGKGMISLGLASEEPVRDARVLLARIEMRKILPQSAMIDFFDPGIDGHTVVLERLDDGSFRDILSLPDSPALVISPLAF